MKHRGLRTAALIVAPALLFAGVAAWQSGWWSDAAPTDLPAPFPSPYRTWAEHVAAIDTVIANHRERAGHEPTDWLSPSAEASTWLDRATMTGNVDDYAAALAAVAVSDSRAIAAVKPYALRARIALALHDNAAVEPLLQAAVVDLTFIAILAKITEGANGTFIADGEPFRLRGSIDRVHDLGAIRFLPGDA